MKGLRPLGDIQKIAFWMQPIFGSEDGGGEGGDDGGQGGEGGQGGDKGGEGGSGGDPDDDGDDADYSAIDDPKDRRIAELSGESAKKRRLLREAKAEKEKADQEIAKLKKQLEKPKDGENKGISDEERQAIEQPHIEKLTKYETAMRNIVLQNALLAEANGPKERVWHDPETVIGQIDLDAIDFDPESGTIEGVEAELDRIAKSKAFLVKSTKKAKKTSEGDDQQQQRKQGASGRQPGGAGSQNHGMDQSRREALTKKYRPLQRR